MKHWLSLMTVVIFLSILPGSGLAQQDTGIPPMLENQRPMTVPAARSPSQPPKKKKAKTASKAKKTKKGKKVQKGRKVKTAKRKKVRKKKGTLSSKKKRTRAVKKKGKTVKPRGKSAANRT